MADIIQKFNKLVELKKDLADNLVTKGVDASQEELFNTLIPKVLDISGGSGVDFGDWIVGQFSVASDTAEAQIIDFSELEGDVYEIKLLIHTNNFTHSGKAYSIIGGQTFAGNGLITYNYKGDYGPATQWSNCPLTVDLSNRTITFGPAGGSFRFRAGYTYQYVIIPIYN